MQWRPLDGFIEPSRYLRTEMATFESPVPQGVSADLREACRFFVKEGPVWDAIRAVTARLSELKIAYAVVGGMALYAHGYVRMTVDIDILVDSAGLATIHRELEHMGCVARSAGSKHLIHVGTQVRIDFLVAGRFPGDGRPKPVAFPSPEAAVEFDGIRYLALPRLIELKLASGMSNPGRLKDLGDVQELIRVLKLPLNFADQLNEFVRAKYHELWEGVAADVVELD